jgi:hypothetical protein
MIDVDRMRGEVDISFCPLLPAESERQVEKEVSEG